MANTASARSWTAAVSAAGLTLFAYVALFMMQTSTANYDPQFMRVLVERTAAYGGSYYSNGIHNKGPLEPFVYSAALHLGGADGFWFVIAFFTLLAAFAIALAGAAVVIIDHGGTATMATLMALIFAHFTVSAADYAGVLYSRNMSVGLLSIAFFVGVIDRAWATPRRRWAAVAVVGGAIGLAVQTLITAAFTGGAVLLWVMWWRRRDRVGRLPVWVALALTAAVVFVSAPIYYRLFGDWRNFVDGFWTHARYMGEGTRRSLPSQFGLGWKSLLSYYGERPELVVPLAGWVAMVIAGWRHASPAQRSMRLLFVAWWVGAWLELVLSQRYSSHYFSVVAVPTALIMVDLTTSVIDWLGQWFEPRPIVRLMPLLAVLAVLDGSDTLVLGQGLETFTTLGSISDFTERREANQDPRLKMTRAALDLVSDDGDSLLMWTNYPWPYLDLHRVSATRYIWKSFLVGEIYLGATSEEYVLADTWDNFADDLAESDPRSYLVETVTPLKDDTPFADYVDENFTPIYDDADRTLSFRNDIVGDLTSRGADGRTDGDGFDVDVESGTTLAMCERIDGTLSTDGTSVVDVIDTDDELVGRITIVPTVEAVFADTRLANGSIVQNYVATDGTAAFSLIAGARSVVLIVEGRIIAAVAADRDSALVWQKAAVGGTSTQSPAPAITGCSTG